MYIHLLLILVIETKNRCNLYLYYVQNRTIKTESQERAIITDIN